MTDLAYPPKPVAGDQAGASDVAGVLVGTLGDAYLRVRSCTEALASALSPEDQCAQSMTDASPAKWHRAHTTWFFETFVLKPFADGYTPPEPRYAVLFNSYYNAVGAQYYRPHRGLLTRPSVDEVAAYRRHVDRHVCELLTRADLMEEVRARVMLGLHHEQQHQELLLTDLKHLWSHNPLEPVYARDGEPDAAGAPSLTWRRIEGGVVEVGAGGDRFHFDNEGPRHQAVVPAFDMGSRLVTNGEYAQFIEDGGYRRPELWLDAGFAWVQRSGVQAPLYWRREGTGFVEYTLYGRRPVRAADPVAHVSFYEAEAFARWAGARLPTEAEWETFAEAPPRGALGDPPARFHPAAGQLPDTYGQCWQWTRSDYAPYPGFRPVEGAVGEYNGKFMSGQYVLRGSSCFTPLGHARRTYRNFFPPTARWQVTGLRLARDP